MKIKKIILCSLLFLFGYPQQGEAVSITDTYNAGHRYMSRGHNNTTTWTVDLTRYGFDPRTQDLCGVTILLDLEDDRQDSSERAILTAGNNRFQWEVNTGEVTFTPDDLRRMARGGVVTFSLNADRGDFFFNGAHICFETTDPPRAKPTPEPATSMLLGAGLLGMGATMRLRKKRS